MKRILLVSFVEVLAAIVALERIQDYKLPNYKITNCFHSHSIVPAA